MLERPVLLKKYKNLFIRIKEGQSLGKFLKKTYSYYVENKIGEGMGFCFGLETKKEALREAKKFCDENSQNKN